MASDYASLTFESAVATAQIGKRHRSVSFAAHISFTFQLTLEMLYLAKSLNNDTKSE